MLALPVIVAALVANGEEIRRQGDGDEESGDDKEGHATNRKANKEAKKKFEATSDKERRQVYEGIGATAIRHKEGVK